LGRAPDDPPPDPGCARRAAPPAALAPCHGGRQHPTTQDEKDDPMFVAMNRFRVTPGAEAEFEQVWKTRDSHLQAVPGFLEFRLLRGPAREDHVLYASHSLWRSRADFEAWTRSEAFRMAHRGAGQTKPLYAGHPEFEGFETIQTLRRPEAAAAE
jgi:heme-degrading monooxygenase HmoA